MAAGQVKYGKGQTEKNLLVMFQILNTAGTPSIVNLSPADAVVSVVDTGTGDYAVTIPNFKGPQGVVNIQACVRTISMFASAISPTYTGDSLAFDVKVENDASTASDASVDVRVEAF